MITLILPMPPSVNACYANRPGFGRVKTAAYRNWLKEAGWEVVRQAPGLRPIIGDVSVDMVFERRRDRRSDLDNRCKALLDLLTKQRAWIDDSQVVELRMAYATDAQVPVTGVIVTFCEARAAA